MRDDRLAEAAGLRKAGRPADALPILLALCADHPGDATIEMLTAWTYDNLGLEIEAVSHYEAALSAGLSGDDLCGTLLGLGSTYRVLGRYADAEQVLRAGVAQFPDYRPLRVFHALALHNLGRHEDALRAVLTELLETTSDADIARYVKPLTEYAKDLSFSLDSDERAG